MEDSIKKEWREGSCFSFGLEKQDQPAPFPLDLQEGKILKAHANLSKDAGIVKINVILLVTLFAMIYISMISNLDPVFDLLYSFIQYLALSALILYNRTTVLLTPEKIIIHRHLFRSLVLRKEDIVQTSSKNKGNSLRWPLRLLILVAPCIQLPHTVESITRYLQLEAAPALVILSSVMVDFWIVAFCLCTLLYLRTHSTLSTDP